MELPSVLKTLWTVRSSRLLLLFFFSFFEVERTGKIVTKSYKQGDSGELPIIPAETITEKSSRRRRSKGCRGTW